MRTLNFLLRLILQLLLELDGLQANNCGVGVEDHLTTIAIGSI